MFKCEATLVNIEFTLSRNTRAIVCLDHISEQSEYLTIVLSIELKIYFSFSLALWFYLLKYNYPRLSENFPRLFASLQQRPLEVGNRCIT